MFEKEAKEYATENYEYIDGRNDTAEITKAFKDGAEYGYNKANEWHYPSKGELPNENKYCLVYLQTNTYEVAYRVTDECWKRKPNTTFACNFQKEIISWQYLPEPPKEIE